MEEYYYLVKVVGLPKEELVFDECVCRAKDVEVDSTPITLPKIYTDEEEAFEDAARYLDEHYTGMWQRWDDVEPQKHKSYQYIWKPVVTGSTPLVGSSKNKICGR